MPFTGFLNRIKKPLILFLLVSSAGLLALTSGLYENESPPPGLLPLHAASTAAAILFVYTLSDPDLYRNINRIALIVAGCGTLLLWVLFPRHTAGTGLVTSAACGLLYYQKLPGIPIAGLGLYRIPFLKNILIGAGWSFAAGPLNRPEILSFHFLFISTLSLLSDIADAEEDKARGVKTGAITTGIPAAGVCSAIIFVLLLALVRYKNPFLPGNSLSLQASCIAALLITPWVAIKRQHFLPKLGIEGVLWLYALSSFISMLNTRLP
jgi:4-hydroxybenzoate polyprenyltransferase